MNFRPKSHERLALDPKQPGSVLSSGAGSLGGGIVREETGGRNHGGGSVGKEVPFSPAHFSSTLGQNGAE